MPRPPSGLPRAPVALSLRGSPEWADWARDLAAQSGAGTLAGLVERLLAKEAKRRRLPPPPPRALEWAQPKAGP